MTSSFISEKIIFCIAVSFFERKVKFGTNFSLFLNFKEHEIPNKVFERLRINILVEEHTPISQYYILEYVNLSKSTSYFWILSHPDDEIFGLPLICNDNSEHVILFLTGRQTKREKEAEDCRKFLCGKGLRVRYVFLQNALIDGHVSSLIGKSTFNEIRNLLKKNEGLDNIVTLKFEGGHQDHDAANLLARLISISTKLPLIQICSYFKSNFFPGFKISRYHGANHTISVASKTIFILFRMISIYKSQFRSWIGLAPLLFANLCSRHFSYHVDTDPTLQIRYDEMNKSLYQSRGRSVAITELENLEKIKLLLN